MSDMSVEPAVEASQREDQKDQSVTESVKPTETPEPTVTMVATPAAVIAVPVDAAVEAANLATQWQTVVAKSRVDSFNQDELITELRALRGRGAMRIALDLRSNRFLSLPVIRVCVDISREVDAAGGTFVLIGCQEKTKRHFEIYGTLDHIRVVRSEADLDRPRRPRDV